MGIKKIIFDLFCDAFPDETAEDNSMSVRRPLTEIEKEDLRDNARKIIIQESNRIN